MFYKFNPGDIITTSIKTFPNYSFLSGTLSLISGALFLFNSSSVGQFYQGYSAKANETLTKTLPSASISIYSAERSNTGSNFQIFHYIENLYTYYHRFYPNIYTASFSGTSYSKFRVIDIPQIYYWQQIHSGSIRLHSGSVLYDNGLGGLLVSGSNDIIVGNVFYSEGLIVLKNPNLWEWGTGSTFQLHFSGTNEIPVNILNCLARPGELNFSNNQSFIISGSNEFKNNMISYSSSSVIYITGIGIYNRNRELVAVAKLAQPIEKNENQSIVFRLRQDR